MFGAGSFEVEVGGGGGKDAVLEIAIETKLVVEGEAHQDLELDQIRIGWQGSCRVVFSPM